MQIILNTEVDNLGFEGDIVNVARGYARNYLIPKGIAVEATTPNIKAFQLKKKKIDAKKLKAREEAIRLKEKIDDIVINLTHKAGEEGKLYGSVTTMDIASALEKEGVIIDRRKILLDRPIKTLGTYDVNIRIYPEVTGTIKVVVNPEEKTEENS